MFCKNLIKELKKKENDISKEQNRILDKLFILRKKIKILEEKEINKKQYKLFNNA